MESLQKTEYEILRITADFSKVRATTNETISAITVTAIDPASVDVSSSVLDISSIATSRLKATILVRAGTENTKYKITFRITTSAGNKWELDIAMSIKPLRFSDVVTKQTYEAFGTGVFFTSRVPVGETIVTQTVSAADATEVDVSTVVLDQSTVALSHATRVDVLVRAGEEASSPYQLTYRCTTSSGCRFEHGVKMKVTEI